MLFYSQSTYYFYDDNDDNVRIRRRARKGRRKETRAGKAMTTKKALGDLFFFHFFVFSYTTN